MVLKVLGDLNLIPRTYIRKTDVVKYRDILGALLFSQPSSVTKF